MAADTLCVCPMATWLWVCRSVIIIIIIIIGIMMMACWRQTLVDDVIKYHVTSNCNSKFVHIYHTILIYNQGTCIRIS